MIEFLGESMGTHQTDKTKVQDVGKAILTVLDDHEQLSVIAIADIIGVHPVTVL